jgi:twitching motility protein PilT
MYSTIQTSAGLGMQTLDQCLRDMINSGAITREDARRRAVNPDAL